MIVPYVSLAKLENIKNIDFQLIFHFKERIV